MPLARRLEFSDSRLMAVASRVTSLKEWHDGTDAWTDAMAEWVRKIWGRRFWPKRLSSYQAIETDGENHLRVLRDYWQLVRACATFWPVTTYFSSEQPKVAPLLPRVAFFES